MDETRFEISPEPSPARSLASPRAAEPRAAWGHLVVSGASAVVTAWNSGSNCPSALWVEAPARLGMPESGRRQHQPLLPDLRHMWDRAPLTGQSHCEGLTR
jgi:hypothetical protein